MEATALRNWNVIVTVSEHGYKKAKQLLAPYGEVAKTGFYNVLLFKTADALGFLETVQNETASGSEFAAAISRVMPVEKKFSFQSPDEFEYKAKKEIEGWIPRLAGKAFHVRMHRRGFKDRMKSVDEEQFLDHFVLEELKAKGETASITFDNPDVIIALETIGNEAGMSFWDRQTLAKHPILKLD
jgi:tRNA(Ser,Leu) C12 N-acetylase TAN1